MGPVTRILRAIVTGAASAGQETASRTARDACAGPNILIKRRFTVGGKIQRGAA